MATSAKKKTAKKARIPKETYRAIPQGLMPETGDYLLRLKKGTFFLVKKKSIARGRSPELISLPEWCVKSILHVKWVEESGLIKDPPICVPMSCR